MPSVSSNFRHSPTLINLTIQQAHTTRSFLMVLLCYTIQFISKLAWILQTYILKIMACKIAEYSLQVKSHNKLWASWATKGFVERIFSWNFPEDFKQICVIGIIIHIKMRLHWDCLARDLWRRLEKTIAYRWWIFIYECILMDKLNAKT